MRLTHFTDYALRLLIVLAAVPDQRLTIRQVSDFHGISRNQLMKVASRLARAGIIRPSRGRKGGLALARPAADIFVGEVIKAAEPDFALVGCMAGEPCSLSFGCRLPGVLEGALAAFLAFADRYSLADIVPLEPLVAGRLKILGQKSVGADQFGIIAALPLIQRKRVSRLNP